MAPHTAEDEKANFAYPNNDISYDIVNEESQHHHRKCGALGDCLGWNNPHNHEAVKRNQLIRRVMLIVFAQLLCVSIMSSIVLFVPPIRDFVAENNTTGSWFFWVAFITAIIFEFGSLIALFVVRKKFPLNMIVLFVFTISTGNFNNFWT